MGYNANAPEMVMFPVSAGFEGSFPENVSKNSKSRVNGKMILFFITVIFWFIEYLIGFIFRN